MLLFPGGYLPYTEGETSSVIVYQSSNLNIGPIAENNMIERRGTPTCAIIRSPAHNNRPVVIVVGSSGYYSFAATTHAEMWDFTVEGSSWIKSKLIHVFRRYDASSLNPGYFLRVSFLVATLFSFFILGLFNFVESCHCHVSCLPLA